MKEFNKLICEFCKEDTELSVKEVHSAEKGMINMNHKTCKNIKCIKYSIAIGYTVIEKLK